MTGSVVLLESDRDARDRFETVLSEQGVPVTSADSLARGRPLAEDPSVRLLIANLLLEDGPTFELARSFAASGRPALGLSDVYKGPTTRQILCQRLGLVAILETPIDDEELVEHVTRLLPELAIVTEIDDQGTTAETELVFVRPPLLDPTDVPLSGSFDEADVAAVLARLALERANGALMLQAERVKKLVYFDDGVPVGVKSNLLHECLGQLLVREGRISAEDCQISLDEMKRTRRQQGEVLIAMGLLEPDELGTAIERQFLTKLEQLFHWTEGAYRYRDATIPAAYHGPPLGTPAQLIWRAIEAARPVERVRALLDPFADYVVEWRGGGLDVDALPLPGELEALYPQLDGRHTTADALGATGRPDDTWLLLYALTAFGAVAYLSADAT